jgi:hypothetical protein
MARYNLRIVGFIASSLPLILAVTSCQQSPTSSPPPPPVRQPVVKGDSPAEVIGGSIFLKWKQYYAPQANGSVIRGTSDDTTMLDFENLGAKTSITAASGWKIHISNRDKKSKEIDDAIVVCSDPNCSFSPGDGKTYYVKLRQGQVVDPNPPANNEMHFHDKQNCGGMHEDPQCDKAVRFKFEIGGPASPDIEACNNDGAKKCTVFIGTR